ncbi:MAG: STAS domain-containing protein [Bacteroidales bacterium]|nr:STAS domain-containing protein [Bacteroidales bacterium]
MMVKKTRQAFVEERIVKIENEFSIKNAEEITQKLEKNIRNAKTILVKLEHIEHFDLSAIQIMKAMHQYAERKNMELRFEMQLSDDVKSLLIKTGFDDFI